MSGRQFWVVTRHPGARTQVATCRRKNRPRRGGKQRRARSSGDGAYTVRPDSSYARGTAGRIPGNVFEAGHVCVGRNRVQGYAKAHGLPPHGAMFPERLVAFFIEFLTQAGELVADPFAGGATVPAVEERLGREWVATDLMLEYIQAAGAARFSPDMTWFNPMLWRCEQDGLPPRRLAVA